MISKHLTKQRHKRKRNFFELVENKGKGNKNYDGNMGANQSTQFVCF
jgi:hypothetical protein